MSDDDGLIPIYKPEARPPLPVDISTLKRKKPFDGADGHRIYSGANNEELVVDDELLSDDELLFDQDDVDFEDMAQNSKRQKLQESTTREMIARAQLAQKKRANQKLTRDQARLAVVLRTNDITNQDQLARFANDEENLITIPVKSPFQSFVNETLGPEEPRIRCFGCTKGVGLARIAPRSIANLERLIKETISTQDVWTSCVLISQYFEEEIRIPSNANRSKVEAELVQWSPRSIYDHLTSHTMEPSFVLFKSIMEIREHLQIISSSGLYRVPKEIYSTGRQIEVNDLIIDDKRHKQLMETTKVLTQLMNQKPDRMMFSNSNFNLHTTPQQIVVQKNSAKEVERQESIFRKTDLTEKSTYKT